MSFLLGIDLGTSSVKCVLAAEDGSTWTAAEREYPILTGNTGWSEQNPDDWWEMTVEAVQELMARTGVKGREVKAIGMSGQMHGTVFLGERAQLLRPAIIWPDQRSSAQCQHVYQQIGYQRLAQIAGSGVFPGFMLASLLWVQQNETQNWDQLCHVLFPKDYVRYQLTGQLATDITDASGGLLADIRDRNWSDVLLTELSIPANILPHVFESHEIAGQLTAEAARTMGLDAGIPVVAGAADQATGALGSGIVSADVVAATIGTGGQLVTLLSSPRIDGQLRVHTFCHAVPDMWYLLGATLSAGLAFRWLRDAVLGEPQPGAYERMTALAGEVAPGAEGLFFLPYLVGERTVKNKAQTRGAFFGLSLGHDRSHLIRAAMEGIIFSLRRVLDVFYELDVQPRQIVATGGGARSVLWCQIMADTFQAPVAQLKVQEQSALGAVILAGLGVGSYADTSEASQTFVTYGSPIEPEPASAAIYEDLYESFGSLYRNVSSVSNSD
jgi:xylulokinase